MHYVVHVSNIEQPQWTLADRLRKAREQSGLSQQELAEQARIARGTVSAAENGRRRPSGSVVSMWALATGVSRDWLLGDDRVNPSDALDEMRLVALLAVIGAASRPQRPGAVEAPAVLEAVSKRESEIQSAGEWVASSKIDHPEVLAWCRSFQPWTADALEEAMAREA